uniref:Uncharacterized protein n=1 Tax=Plectus sambesii TaxID=2011161 RepID=A0A914VZD6_9BILA
PIEKIANNRLTFREALTLMKAHVEIKNHGQGIEEAKKTLRDHPAAQRIDQPHIDRMLQYFLPFEVIKEQRLVRVTDMLRERKRQQGMDDFRYMAEKEREWKSNLEHRRARDAEFFDDEDEHLRRQIEGGKIEEQKLPGEENIKKDEPK